LSLTDPKWETARRLGGQHWRDTVRPADGMLWMIRDPYTQPRPRDLKRGAVEWQDVASSADAAHVKIAS